MQPGDRERIPTVAEAVSRAAAIADPDSVDDSVRALLEAFEDDERPATAAEDLLGELRSSAEAIAPEGDAPGALVTAAAAGWLATNPGDGEDPERVLREGTRLLFAGDPPPAVEEWLGRERGTRAS